MNVSRDTNISCKAPNASIQETVLAFILCLVTPLLMTAEVRHLRFNTLERGALACEQKYSYRNQQSPLQDNFLSGDPISGCPEYPLTGRGMSALYVSYPIGNWVRYDV